MKTHLILSATLALLLPLAPTPSYAQYGIEQPKANTRAARKAAGETRKTSKASKATPLFANTTRVEPEPVGAPALSKQLSALFELQEKEGSSDLAIAKADEILADARATPFDKSTAGYIAGYVWLAKDSVSYTNAIRYLRGAVNDNGLSNNTHFQIMLQLAQMLESDDKHAEALAFVDRFLAETKSEDPRAYNLRAQIMLSSDKPAEAAKALEELLARKPNDKTVMMNLASVYQQTGNDAKTIEIFNKMHAAGLFTTSKDYEIAFRLLANVEGQEKQAMAMIDEGLKKGILTPGYDVYAYQGRIFYQSEQIPQAIEAWTKAAPLGKDGEMFLNLAKLQAQDEHWAEARAAAQSALTKGIKKKGEAYQALASAELGLGNKTAAKAAMLEAAKYPETKKWAEAALRQPSVK